MARAEAILRSLVAAYPDLTQYRHDLANTIRALARTDREIGQHRGAESRLREALAIAETVQREDSGHLSNIALVGILHGDLAALQGAEGRPADARPMFTRAVDLLDQARARSPEDARIRRTLVEVLAARAEFLGRLELVPESLADWDKALALAAGDDVLDVRLGRAALLSRSGAARTALADAAAAEREATDRPRLLIRLAVVYAQVSRAKSHDPALSFVARASGTAAEFRRAMDLIKRARGAPAYRDSRRLLHALAASEFDPLRGHAEFQLLLMDLAFPSNALASPE
jgi:tetratricopeptide (TPR) repeat protein